MKEILKLDPNAKVLVASGHASDPSARDSPEIGAKGLLDKPFRVNDLLRDVRKFIDLE